MLLWSNVMNVHVFELYVILGATLDINKFPVFVLDD